MAAGVVQIPWYATLFRGDKFAEALKEIAPVALRYGARDFQIYRNRDDLYKFNHMMTFDDKVSWEAYWYGDEFIEWRAAYSSWYQVPVLYTWNDLILEAGKDRPTSSVVGREADATGDSI
jgi:hypothetical protein